MSLGSTVSAKQSAWTLKVPAERGAVVIFSLSTIVALFYCRSNITEAACALVVVWLMMLSAHNSRLLLAVSFPSIIAMALTGHIAAALFIGFVLLGIEMMQTSAEARHLWWRELIGLAGAGSIPLIAVALMAGEAAALMLAGTALLAAIMTGLCLIHACRPDLKVSPLPSALLSALFWIILEMLNPNLTISCLIPYCAQVLWILKRKRPGFKQLGLAQSACLLWIAASLVFLG